VFGYLVAVVFVQHPEFGVPCQSYPQRPSLDFVAFRHTRKEIPEGSRNETFELLYNFYTCLTLNMCSDFVNIFGFSQSALAFEKIDFKNRKFLYVSINEGSYL